MSSTLRLRKYNVSTSISYKESFMKSEEGESEIGKWRE